MNSIIRKYFPFSFARIYISRSCSPPATTFIFFCELYLFSPNFYAQQIIRSITPITVYCKYKCCTYRWIFGRLKNNNKNRKATKLLKNHTRSGQSNRVRYSTDRTRTHTSTAVAVWVKPDISTKPKTKPKMQGTKRKSKLQKPIQAKLDFCAKYAEGGSAVGVATEQCC